jgi:LPXTG-site transpeptidase (sortase) family protein
MGAVSPGTIVINTASVEWSSLPGNVYRPPNQISPHNDWSTERWYDPNDMTDLNTYGGVYSAAVVRSPTTGFELPATGFAPNQWSEIPQQPKEKAYQTYGEIWLEIPSLGIKATIVGIPLSEGGWDATWLWDQAGYLQGTAFPTWEGNTVITSHVYLPNGLPGPFVNIGQLSWGDEIIIHAFGQRYIYQVRERRAVLPYDMSVIGHKEEDWVTLLTCSYFEESSQTYRYRLVVQAVLISYGADVP